MATAQIEDSPLARLILSKERSHLLAPTVDPSIPVEPTSLAQSSIPLPIVVLTEDATFSRQIRAALNPSADLTIVRTPNDAAELAVSGRCSILITDQALTKASIEELRARLRAHDPALVFIAAGTRDSGGLLIGLQSSGTVDGFLLKPVTSGAAQLLIESASKRYRAFGSGGHAQAELTRVRSQAPAVVASAQNDTATTIEARRPARVETVAPTRAYRPPRSVPRPSWSLVIAALLVVAAGVWTAMSKPVPSIDPQKIIAEHLAHAESAQQSGRWIGQRNSAAFHFQTVLALDPQNLSAQRGLDRVAAELSRRTQAAMSQRRLAEAAATLESLRELQPEYAELPLLNAQLKLLRDAVLAEHTPIPAVQKSEAPQTVQVANSSVLSRTSRRAVRAPVEATPVPQRPIELPQQESPAPTSTISNAPVESPSVTRTTERASTPPPEAVADLSSVQAAVPLSVPVSVPVSDPIDVASVPVEADALIDASIQGSASPPVPVPVPVPSEPAPQATSSAPTLLKYVAPNYPTEAQARALEGWVQVSLQVTPAGDVVKARVEDGQKRQLFARAALSAVRQWKYEPRPDASGETPVTVRLDFKLEPLKH